MAHPTAADFDHLLTQAEAKHKTRLARMAAESDVEAKHPEGEEMTQEEVTKGMSPEEKAKWISNTEKHKDKFKKKKAEDDALLRRLLAEEDMDNGDNDDNGDDNDDDDKEAKKKARLAAMLPSERQRLTWDKEAGIPGGLYGFTKKTQADCETSIRRLQKEATRLAASGHKRDPRIASFLAAHAKRADSLPAKILVAAMKDVGPKIAGWGGGTTTKNEWQEALRDDEGMLRKYEADLKTLVKGGKVENLTVAGAKSTIAGLKAVIQNKKNLLKKFGADTPEIRAAAGPTEIDKVREMEKLTGPLTLTEEGEENLYFTDGDGKKYVFKFEGRPADTKKVKKYLKEGAGPEYGLYGHRRKTATLGLSMCSEVRDVAGRVAYNLHARRAARHERITGFFRTHGKKARCPMARILLSSYPDVDIQGRTASTEPATVNDWLAWDER